MDSVYMLSRSIPTDLMGKTVISRRSPFKVHQALWNPNIDLLTLASQKGEVCVRRLHWRNGWKRDIYDVKPLLLDRIKSEGEIRLETMCWSPDGKILATAFSDGCIHLLDAEKGIVRFTIRMKTRVTRMKWQRFSEKLNMNLISEDALSGALGDLTESESLNDKSEELNQLRAMKAFCDNSNLSILGTLLFALNVDNVVIVLAAGVLPIASIEPPLHFFGKCDPYSITVGDMFYSAKRCQLIVIYSSMGQLNPTANNPGINTQMVGFDIDSLGYLKNGLIWTIAHRWLKLVFYVCFVSEAFARAIIHWEDQSKEFHRKFNSFGENASNCNLGECFINMILSGQASPELVNFYRNVLKPTEWKKMIDWANRGFSDMIGSIGRELLPGAKALQHNMKQLFIEARCALRSSRTENLLPRRLFDVDVYPYGKYADETDEEAPFKEFKDFQNLAEDIMNKINEMHLVATRNRKDLINFTSWLSQTPPFTAKNKRSAAELKFDLQLITEVLQYFDHQKPLKYRLDVRSNAWDLFCEQQSTKTLADSITNCFDVLQTIQDIFLKNFTATVVAQTNTVLEQSHAEGFEKFAIFLPLETKSECHKYEEEKWLLKVADEPFAISCIGVNGSRHIIYGASSKELYKLYYAKQCMKNVASFSGDVEQISLENSNNSDFQTEVDNIRLSSNEQQSKKIGKNAKGVDNVMPKSPTAAKLSRIENPFNSSISHRLVHFEWYGNGSFYGLLKVCKANKEETVLFRSCLFDNSCYLHEDTSGCTESYVSFTVSFHRKSGVVFTENGFRAKWFKIKIPLQKISVLNRKQSKSDIRQNNQVENIITEAMDMTDHIEELVVGKEYHLFSCLLFIPIGLKVDQMSEDNGSVNDVRRLVQKETRKGDVISPHRAIMTLSKSMFNAGCFSLPYAWKLGGLWMSLILNFVIAGFNWYGDHILVRSSQHLAKKSERVSLDYGHFAKKVCDYSDIRILRNNSKIIMYIVNITILFYQLGMCSVAILFIANNMNHLLGDYIPGGVKVMALISFVPILALNMFTEMRLLSVFAMISSAFFLLGAFVIMQFTVRQPNHWQELPGITNFTGVIMFVGMAMYAFEGQTMILPVENKLETPEDFLNNFGVLPTTMCFCTLFMIAIGFYGYTAFGANTEPTITMNVPKEGLYSTINVFLMLQSMLGHSVAMYVILDMFFNGFSRKFTNRFPNISKVIVDKGFRIFWVSVTMLMSISIPHLEIMIPLVGVTSGTLCALIYPPIFEMITFWNDWKVSILFENIALLLLKYFIHLLLFSGFGLDV
uniref:Anaphase-promoting complex subunit 4 WD40 domain-containing protein n=1 Tax=Onchocerca volvulus TaxID=6282 RepID=A0A8R1U1N4_ONCVO